jgi:hypothetical protein
VVNAIASTRAAQPANVNLNDAGRIGGEFRSFIAVFYLSFPFR